MLGSVQEDAAIATADLAEGETVTLSLSDGLLHADPGGGDATGVTTTSAAEGEVVGVTGFEGVIDLDPGHVSVIQVPPVRSGPVENIDDIAAACADVPIVPPRASNPSSAPRCRHRTDRIRGG